jgi:hypothetical protein
VLPAALAMSKIIPTIIPASLQYTITPLSPFEQSQEPPVDDTLLPSTEGVTAAGPEPEVPLYFASHSSVGNRGKISVIANSLPSYASGKRFVSDKLLHAVTLLVTTAYQEDKVLVCRDLNALIPTTNDNVDRSIRRSLFAIFDGRKYL